MCAGECGPRGTVPRDGARAPNFELSGAAPRARLHLTPAENTFAQHSCWPNNDSATTGTTHCEKLLIFRYYLTDIHSQKAFVVKQSIPLRAILFPMFAAQILVPMSVSNKELAIKYEQ